MRKHHPKPVVTLLTACGKKRSALVVTGAPDRNVLLSARNIDETSYLPADTLNTYDILKHKQLVLTVDAVRRIEALWGGERANQRRPRRPVAAAGTAAASEEG